MPGGRLIAAAAIAMAAASPVTAAAAAPERASVLVRAAPAQAPGLVREGALPALPRASLARLERRIGRALPELRGLYRVDAGGPADARRIAARLDARAGVDADAQTASPPPPAVCRAEPEEGWPAFEPGGATPDLSGLQDYRGGLDIPDAAAAEGVRIGDVEYDWRVTHEELAGRELAAPVLTPGGLDPSFQAEDHGTAVLGILGADRDGEGVTGIAHGAEILPLSPFFEDQPRLYDLLQATLDAALALRPGDVLLIEQQALVQTPSGRAFAPVEAVPAVRDVIRAVVEAGIIVVEPAGNGGRDLASLGLPWLADPSDPGRTGAIVVGAGNSSATGADRSRSAGSNYGARVDLQGYGAGVLTAGYGQGLGPAEPKDRAYTSCFDGTSSASATVAGAVAALQGLAIAIAEKPLTPEAARRLLVATGAPETSPREPIGPRPQVAAAAALVAPADPPAGAREPAALPPASPSTATPPPPPPAARGAATLRGAATGALARLDRRDGTLTITLRGLAPGAVAFVGTRRVRLAGGRLVLPAGAPRRFVLVVSAPPGARVGYSIARFRITVKATGPARIARL